MSYWHFTFRPFTRSSFSWTTTYPKSDVYSSSGLSLLFIICCSGFSHRLLLSILFTYVENCFLSSIWLYWSLSTGRKWSMLKWPLIQLLARPLGTIRKPCKNSLINSKKSLTTKPPNSKRKSPTPPVKVTLLSIFRVQRIHRWDFGRSFKSQHETTNKQRKRTRVGKERRIRRRRKGRGKRRMIVCM